MIEKILPYIDPSCPWTKNLIWYDSIDSTNIQAKKLAKEGAAHGTVLIAGEQTAGRGRLGRSYHSAPDKGLYLSVILRPNCLPEQLMHLTCAAGVASATAIEKQVGLRPHLKWINDIILGNKKLGGILTELSINPKNNFVDYAIIGIGINCTHQIDDFPEELREMATSLWLQTGIIHDRYALAGTLISELLYIDSSLITKRSQIMKQYQKDCITIGKQIVVIQNDTQRYGTAVDVNEDGSLSVLYPDGETERVQSGEVSVRGMYGYIS